MKEVVRYPERSRKWNRGPAITSEQCELCGAEMDVDPESGEQHCPVCENPEEAD